MTPRKVPINWNDLEIAVERNAPTTESFLDLSSGHVITIVGGDPEAPLLKRQVSEKIANYLRIEPASSREQYRWMERFVTSVADEQLRDRLIISIDGKGAFRRFKDVLLAYPAERERWFGYRGELLHWHIHNWLAENHIESTTPPPWGDVQPPAELETVAARPTVPGAETPGEALRRQARELIDTIPAIDLPSAIAFLEFLRMRGAQALARDADADVEAEADGDEATPPGQRWVVG